MGYWAAIAAAVAAAGSATSSSKAGKGAASAAADAKKQSRTIAKRGMALNSPAWFDAPAGSSPYMMNDGTFQMGSLDENGMLVYPQGSRNPSSAVEHYEGKLANAPRVKNDATREDNILKEDIDKWNKKLDQARSDRDRDQSLSSQKTNLQAYQDMFKGVHEPLRIQATDEISVGQQVEQNALDKYSGRGGFSTSGFASAGKQSIEATRQNRILGVNQKLKGLEKSQGLEAAYAGRAGAVSIAGGIPVIPQIDFSSGGVWAGALGQGANQLSGALALRDPSQKNKNNPNAFYDSGSYPRQEGQPQFSTGY